MNLAQANKYLVKFMSELRSLHRGAPVLLKEFLSLLNELDFVKSAFFCSYPEQNSNNHASYTRWIGLAQHKQDLSSSIKENVESKLQSIDQNLSTQNIEEMTFYPMGSNKGQVYTGFILFDSKVSSEINREELKLVSYFFDYCRSQFEQLANVEKNHELMELVHRDDVTQLYNQRKLHLDLDHFINQYKKNGETFSVFFIDVDHFKKVNDGHGHMVGTQLLKDVGRLIKSVVRDQDLVYRYGGDEFVVLLGDLDGQKSKEIGERVLKKIQEHNFQTDEGLNFNLSLSIGISRFPMDANSKNDILKLADQMMYKAKQKGRGSVCFAGEFWEEEKVELTEGKN